MLHPSPRHQLDDARSATRGRLVAGTVDTQPRSVLDAAASHCCGACGGGVPRRSADEALHACRQPQSLEEFGVFTVCQDRHRPILLTVFFPIGYPERVDTVACSGPSLVYKSYELFFIYHSPLVQ